MPFLSRIYSFSSEVNKDNNNYKLLKTLNGSKDSLKSERLRKEKVILNRKKRMFFSIK